MVPALEWLPAYDRRWLQRDVVAGLTTAAVILPKAMAYAALAGLPVQVGLYTALVPTAVYAFLGSSRRLSVSTTTTIGILTAAEVAAVAPDGDPAQAMAVASTLAVMVGLLLVLASALRLGFLANFISDPVLTGFKAGVGVVIVVDQVPKLLDIHFHEGRLLRERDCDCAAQPRDVARHPGGGGGHAGGHGGAAEAGPAGAGTAGGRRRAPSPRRA